MQFINNVMELFFFSYTRGSKISEDIVIQWKSEDIVIHSRVIAKKKIISGTHDTPMLVLFNVAQR